MSNGKLYICGTPIGNLEDMSFRVIRILKEVSIIYAEDTRHTIKLLNYFEIDNKLKSYHKHNKKTAGLEIIKQLENGKQMALVSDAGMPGISDPGSDLINLCIERDIDFEVIPGPTAFVLGLIQSGMSTERFAFEGFLDRKKSLKEEQLEKIKSDNRTLVFYESPHRLKKTLKSMLKVLGNRKISISREITKKFEEVIRLHLSEALDYYEENDPRGEYVLTVEGNLEEEIIEYNMPIKDHIIAVMAEGKSKKEAIKSVAKLRNINKNVVYKESFDIALKD
ncbi:MAG TPA: 16S rRNA (cytidine(1402)-2'-O)-methyltransferase [Clostridia bacterium]|nr:16S rRNA (cytidine(1402)-2'-O)-methyltransferase [Clostridia bacterium]